MKSKSFLSVLVLYFLLLAGFCIFYSSSFRNFSAAEGDAYNYYLKIITAVTYLFFLILHFGIAKINLAYILFIPILILFLGITITLAGILATGADSPAQTFYIHTCIHLIISFLSVRLLWRKYFEK